MYSCHYPNDTVYSTWEGLSCSLALLHISGLQASISHIHRHFRTATPTFCFKAGHSLFSLVLYGKKNEIIKIQKVEKIVKKLKDIKKKKEKKTPRNAKSASRTITEPCCFMEGNKLTSHFLWFEIGRIAYSLW